jgi:hypothetical protein
MDTHSTPDFGIRRQAQRFSVALPVELERGKGVTRDVSASGVFFETDRLFSPGAPITFCLVLEHVTSVGPIRLHCQGTIVRVERRNGKVGVAVAIDSHRIDPGDEPSAVC